MGKTADERQKRLYREQMGHEAAQRQEEIAATTCGQCGGREGRHHPMCRRLVYGRNKRT